MTGPLSTNSERQSQHGQTQRCVGGHRLSQPTSQRISSQGREDERTMNDDARHLRTHAKNPRPGPHHVRNSVTEGSTSGGGNQ